MGEVSALPALAGILCLTAMLLLRHSAPRIPAALIVMSMATILIGLLGGDASGVLVAGHIPSGLPSLTWPNLDTSILRELAPGALAIVLVGYAEALGAAKAAAMQDGNDIDPNQDLVAHGPANILTDLFGGFLVVSSLSKTSVAMAAGARSQICNLVAAALCFLTLILLTPLFRNMPQPALAAIVIAAMLHLTTPSYLRGVLARSHWSFAAAVIVIVIAGELTLGVLHGIALGVVLSIARLIYLVSRPKGAVLGQLPSTEAYRDVQMHPEAITFPGLPIWRIGGDLFFASVGRIGARLRAEVALLSDVKWVLLDFGSVDFLDITGGDELLRLLRELQKKGISVAFVRVRDARRRTSGPTSSCSTVGATAATACAPTGRSSIGFCPAPS
jgi:SulP family sulfate permease